jgi:hypothetical protein
MKIAAARAVATLPRKNLARRCEEWRTSCWNDRDADISDASALGGPKIANAASRKIQMNYIRTFPEGEEKETALRRSLPNRAFTYCPTGRPPSSAVGLLRSGLHVPQWLAILHRHLLRRPPSTWVPAFLCSGRPFVKEVLGTFDREACRLLGCASTGRRGSHKQAPGCRTRGGVRVGGRPHGVALHEECRSRAAGVLGYFPHLAIRCGQNRKNLN